MGVITDYVVADVTEAREVLTTISPTKRWIGVDARTIDNVKIAKLGLILEGKPVTRETFKEYSRGIKELASGGDEGPWVLLVPDRLTSKLATLSKEDLADVATQWHAVEEFRLDHWEGADVASLLKELHQLAQRAASSRKPLLLFMSL